jgi:hypothetical protein
MGIVWSDAINEQENVRAKPVYVTGQFEVWSRNSSTHKHSRALYLCLSLEMWSVVCSTNTLFGI